MLLQTLGLKLSDLQAVSERLLWSKCWTDNRDSQKKSTGGSIIFLLEDFLKLLMAILPTSPDYEET